MYNEVTVKATAIRRAAVREADAPEISRNITALWYRGV